MSPLPLRNFDFSLNHALLYAGYRLRKNVVTLEVARKVSPSRAYYRSLRCAKRVPQMNMVVIRFVVVLAALNIALAFNQGAGRRVAVGVRMALPSRLSAAGKSLTSSSSSSFNANLASARLSAAGKSITQLWSTSSSFNANLADSQNSKSDSDCKPPVYYTVKKMLPQALMFFCILFNYTILRDTKDVLVVTAPKSGAEIIPFLKTVR
jgi:hypothetical protein